jgi:hypothetical protein
MRSPRVAVRLRAPGRRWALGAALAVGAALPSLVGCQAEYAGMTLPSGKYLHDDVQYFQPGPDFPWANTNAATQRARMEAMGFSTATVPVPGQGGPITPPAAGGAFPPDMTGGAAAEGNVMQNPPGEPLGRGLPGVNQPVVPPPAEEPGEQETIPPSGPVGP